MDRPRRKDLTDPPTERMPQPSDAMNQEPSETNSDSSSNGPAPLLPNVSRAIRTREQTLAVQCFKPH